MPSLPGSECYIVYDNEGSYGKSSEINRLPPLEFVCT